MYKNCIIDKKEREPKRLYTLVQFLMFDKDHKGYSLRAIVSSLVGELFDSAIFIPLAFLGSMPNNVLFKMIILQVIFKVGYEIILLPVNNIVMKKVDKIHNKELNNI